MSIQAVYFCSHLFSFFFWSNLPLSFISCFTWCSYSSGFSFSLWNYPFRFFYSFLGFRFALLKFVFHFCWFLWVFVLLEIIFRFCWSFMGFTCEILSIEFLFSIHGRLWCVLLLGQMELRKEMSEYTSFNNVRLFAIFKRLARPWKKAWWFKIVN